MPNFPFAFGDEMLYICSRMGQKSLYQRFRDWQLNPFPAEKVPSSTPHQCANCGHFFEGNYCPVCGQDREVGRVSWKSVHSSLKSLMGKNGKAGGLIPFVAQLFGRPGYMISDYISGRRKVCDSPVEKLLLMVTCALLVQSVTGFTSSYQDLIKDVEPGVMTKAFTWLTSHMSWAIIIQTALLIFPTWHFFRNSPKHNHHSIPDGIYIQLFMACLVLFFVMLRCMVGDWVLVFIPVYYYIAYRQLFGYGVWGTLWRTLFSILSIFLLFAGIMMAIMYL